MPCLVILFLFVCSDSDERGEYSPQSVTLRRRYMHTYKYAGFISPPRNDPAPAIDPRPPVSLPLRSANEDEERVCALSLPSSRRMTPSSCSCSSACRALDGENASSRALTQHDAHHSEELNSMRKKGLPNNASSTDTAATFPPPSPPPALDRN